MQMEKSAVVKSRSNLVPARRNPNKYRSISINNRKEFNFGVLQKMADSSLRVTQLLAIQTLANTSQSVLQKAAIPEEIEEEPAQLVKNNTGLPDNLKQGMETMTGHSMDQVRVHYNSPKPATLQAHAYAQGNEIHLASGQEKHLPHELGHVVQQMEGRVRPTLSVDGVGINDDAALESEATVLGNKASKY